MTESMGDHVLELQNREPASLLCTERYQVEHKGQMYSFNSESTISRLRQTFAHHPE